MEVVYIHGMRGREAMSRYGGEERWTPGKGGRTPRLAWIDSAFPYDPRLGRGETGLRAHASDVEASS